MQLMKYLLGLFALLFLHGCLVTTGEIKENRFFIENDFSVDLLDNSWEVVRQQVRVDLGIRRSNTVYEISFRHKNSNGTIGVNSFELDNVGNARSIDIHADDAVARWGGIKLSQKMIKIDRIDAVELVISGKYMVKYIFFKKGGKGYELVYINTPTYFDEYLGVFEKFIGTFKVA